jgi:hypothetical protein
MTCLCRQRGGRGIKAVSPHDMPVQTEGRQRYKSNPFAALAQEGGGVANTTLWLLYPPEDPAPITPEAG